MARTILSCRPDAWFLICKLVEAVLARSSSSPRNCDGVPRIPWIVWTVAVSCWTSVGLTIWGSNCFTTSLIDLPGGILPTIDWLGSPVMFCRSSLVMNLASKALNPLAVARLSIIWRPSLFKISCWGIACSTEDVLSYQCEPSLLMLNGINGFIGWSRKLAPSPS